jgi:hypothetical protein
MAGTGGKGFDMRGDGGRWIGGKRGAEGFGLRK